MVKKLRSEDDKLTSSRTDKSLFNLTRKFLSIVHAQSSSHIDLTKIAATLGILKRRAYDISNILEGLGYLKKVTSNCYEWTGDDIELILDDFYDDEEVTADREQKMCDGMEASVNVDVNNDNVDGNVNEYVNEYDGYYRPGGLNEKEILKTVGDLSLKNENNLSNKKAVNKTVKDFNINNLNTKQAADDKKEVPFYSPSNNYQQDGIKTSLNSYINENTVFKCLDPLCISNTGNSQTCIPNYKCRDTECNFNNLNSKKENVNFNQRENHLTLQNRNLCINNNCKGCYECINGGRVAPNHLYKNDRSRGRRDSFIVSECDLNTYSRSCNQDINQGNKEIQNRRNLMHMSEGDYYKVDLDNRGARKELKSEFDNRNDNLKQINSMNTITGNKDYFERNVYYNNYVNIDHGGSFNNENIYNSNRRGIYNNIQYSEEFNLGIGQHKNSYNNLQNKNYISNLGSKDDIIKINNFYEECKNNLQNLSSSKFSGDILDKQNENLQSYDDFSEYFPENEKENIINIDSSPDVSTIKYRNEGNKNSKNEFTKKNEAYQNNNRTNTLNLYENADNIPRSRIIAGTVSDSAREIKTNSDAIFGKQVCTGNKTKPRRKISDGEQLRIKETYVDGKLQSLNEAINFITENERNKAHLFVTYKDLLKLKSLKNKTAFAVKAPENSFFDSAKDKEEFVLQISTNEEKIDVFYIEDEK